MKPGKRSESCEIAQKTIICIHILGIFDTKAAFT